jgi:glycerol-3-phosphate dehydrogenase
MTGDATWRRDHHADAIRSAGSFDVVIAGGGVTGAGAALDLSARGVSVALLERGDFAQGTSSRSTKLFHGGIRYLPHYEFDLVAEGLREQRILAEIADFLYEPLEFVIPLYEHRGIADAPDWACRGWRAPLALRAGLVLYDLLGGPGRPGDRHRRVDVDEVLALAPSLDPGGLTGGFVYSDAQTDDARLVITLAKTAVRLHGALAAGRMRVDGLRPGPDGYVVTVTDLESGEPFEIRSRAVLLATGAFTPPGLPGAEPMRLVRSKGAHLIVELERLGMRDRAIVLPETDDGRVLYIIPWLGHAMVGTTDDPYDGDPLHPRVEEHEVEYLIRHVRSYLAVPSFEPLSVFAGLRALAASEGHTARASREHVVDEPAPGVVRVAGGKLTTYRRIAAEASDRVAKGLGVDAPSPTRDLPLVGSGSARRPLERRLEAAGVPASAASAIVGHLGGEAARLASLVEERPDLAEPLADGRSVAAETVHAVRHEAAVAISDVTLRRTHLAWFSTDHARKDAERIAELMGAELGWSEHERRRRVAEHEAELEAEGL